MNDPPFCMNLTTENAKSSTGRCGIGPPNALYLQQTDGKRIISCLKHHGLPVSCANVEESTLIIKNNHTLE